MRISFNKADKNITLNNRVALKAFIEKSLKKEGISIESLQYVFCSDKYLLAINNSFLNHDYYTDIISFDLSETKGTLIGEIYISVDRVKENAKTHQAHLNEELLRVIFHGALHFCGYKDKKSADAKIMRSMEDKWLRSYLSKLGNSSK
ncbi:MAG: rRNA maturation RNase YbeY [Sediminibacterium sp.]|jgi:probable rRNA maturation factor